MKTFQIILFLVVFMIAGASVKISLATEFGCTSGQLNNKVLTDVDCVFPGRIEKKCLDQANKCCNTSDVTSCNH